jgi:hypothetical protein
MKLRRYVAALVAVSSVCAGCSCGAADPVDDGGVDCSGNDCGSAGICTGAVANQPCQPTTPCTVGITSCSTAQSQPSCMVTGSKPDRTSCGGGKVCSGGACVPTACDPGMQCQPANPCSEGTIACPSSGALPTCVSAGARPDGAPCGTGLVCSAGACNPACVPDQRCQPANPCQIGTTACGSPFAAPTCLPAGEKLDAPDCGAEPFTHRVVFVHDPDATKAWTGQKDYWLSVDQGEVNRMTERGLAALTGAPDAGRAWDLLLPGYRPGQKIAIKVNFNNQYKQYGNHDPSSSFGIDALAEPVIALLETLVEWGVAATDILVYDAVRGLPHRFTAKVTASHPGVHFYGGAGSEPPIRAGYNEFAGFTSTPVAFRTPLGVPPVTDYTSPVTGARANPNPIHVTGVLEMATYLINMPIVKQHGSGGVSLSFKNHLGSVDCPAAFHPYFPAQPRFTATYHPMVDLWSSPLIGPKTVLIVGDGLFGALGDEEKAPQTWSSFGDRPPSSMFFAIDPVAIDSVMCDVLRAERGPAFVPDSDAYLKVAAAAGLGTYERGDPFGAGYTFIDLRRLELGAAATPTGVR